MKPYIITYAFRLIPVVALSLCVSCTKTKPEAHPYATKNALKSPVIFGGNVISTELPEFATSFSPDGKTAFYNVASPDRKTLRIVQSQFTNNSWREPMPLPFSDGTYRDVDPFVSPDGSRLYFSSNRPTDDNDAMADFDTWYVERTNDGWGEPVNPGQPINSDANEIFVSATSSGKLYFSSDGDTSGGTRIFSSDLISGVHGEPVLVDLGVAPEVNLGNPAISPEGDFLIFATADLGGLGGSDLFMCHLEGEQWTYPINLGVAINSPQSDFAPCISPDGRYLFFTSERPGIVSADRVEGRPPGDIYQVDIPTR